VTAPPRVPLATPTRIDARLLAVPLTAVGGLLLASLNPGWLSLAEVVLVAAAAAAYAGVVVWVRRSIVPVLVLAGLITLVAAANPLRDSLVSGLALSPIFGLSFALLLAVPALLARRAREAPAGDALDRTLARVALWLSALAVGTLAWAGTWHRKGLFAFALLAGDGRLPWKAAFLALAVGAVLAAGVLRRDLVRLRFVAARSKADPAWEIVPWKDAEDPEAPVFPYLAGTRVDGAVVAKTREGASAFRERGVSTVVAWLPLDLGAAHRALVRRAALCAVLILGATGGVVALARALWVHAQPLTGIVAVAPDEGHTCALRRDGDVVCWGLNDVGQLGDGTLDQSYSPVAVRGLHEVATLLPTCALLRSGEVRCWGDVDPRFRESHPVAGIPPARLLAAGGGFTCVVTRADEVLCWTGHAPPAHTLKAPEALELAVGEWGGCVRLPDRLACWVDPEHSDNETWRPGMTCFPSPRGVPPRESTLHINVLDVDEVSAEGAVVRWKGTASSWRGYEPCSDPAVLPAQEGVVALTPRFILDEDGAVRERWSGSRPASSPALTHVIDLRGNGTNTCAVRVDGTVWCQGDNHFGELGDGTRHPSEEMVEVRR
jgi:hypothetical protein